MMAVLVGIMLALKMTKALVLTSIVIMILNLASMTSVHQATPALKIIEEPMVSQSQRLLQ